MSNVIKCQKLKCQNTNVKNTNVKFTNIKNTNDDCYEISNQQMPRVICFNCYKMLKIQMSKYKCQNTNVKIQMSKIQMSKIQIPNAIKFRKYKCLIL